MQPRSHTRRRRMRDAIAPGLLVAAAVVSGCEDPNIGVPPPVDQMVFPTGLLLDPRTPEGEAARYLMVANGNNDLRFNAGSVLVIDLEAFFAAWADEDLHAYPYCEPGGRCILDPGFDVDDEHPCRRLALLPQVVECDEGPFVVKEAGVRIGDFSTVMAASNLPGPGQETMPRIFVPVRGDPSITYMDVRGTWPDPPMLDCGQGPGSGKDNPLRCADDHRLTHLRNDETLDQLAREPYNIMVSETEHYRYAYVAHSAGAAFTLIDLDGLRGGDGRPAIVDSQPLFFFSGIPSGGGFGLAERPCSVEDDNVPSLTNRCERPLIYAGFRYVSRLVSFTAAGIDIEETPASGERDGCHDSQGNFLGPYCAAPDEIGEPCALVCEPRVLPSQAFVVVGLDPPAGGILDPPVLGDIAFGDLRGDALFVLQTNPGALVRLNTSLDFDNEPLDSASSPPIEVCEEPNRMKIWNGMAFVTCFRSAYIYVIDLASFRLVDTIVAGTGPHDLVVDPVRQVLYAANTLEASISVIDLGEHRDTRFEEIARIGIQEPFMQ